MKNPVLFPKYPQISIIFPPQHENHPLFHIISHPTCKSCLCSSANPSPSLPNPHWQSPQHQTEPQNHLKNIIKRLERASHSSWDDFKAILHLFPHPDFQRPPCYTKSIFPSESIVCFSLLHPALTFCCTGAKQPGGSVSPSPRA